MAVWYTDVAQNQKQLLNFPGTSGEGYLTNQPGTQNRPLLEGPPEITATYTWTGNEAANDIINIAIAPAGVVVSPNGKVSSGLTAPAATLTVAIGDNDLAIASLLPITNTAAIQSATGIPAVHTAPNWVSGTTYAPGNVVTDPNSTPANLTYTCVAATSGTTAPHSAATTVWMPNDQRYSAAIDVHAASGNVAFSGGTQLYGGPMSMLPTSVVANTQPANATAAQLANNPYQVQGDCWIQALIVTLTTPAANAVSVFRIPLIASN